MANGGGPEQAELQAKLANVQRLVPYIKLEKAEKLAIRLETEKEYDELYTHDEIEKLLSEVVSYWVDPDKCQACMICARKCPVHGIEGAKGLIHVIDQQMCIKCGSCYDACPEKFDAVKIISGAPVPDPIPEEERVVVRKGKGAGTV